MNATEFLCELYDVSPDEELSHHLLIWTIEQGGKRLSQWYTTVQEATALIAQNLDRHTYYGVGLAPREYGPYNRCPKEEITAIPGLWLDVDIAGDAHSTKALPPSLDHALQLLEKFPLKPTIVVHSGHGLQAYWLFNELWELPTDEERAKAALLSQRFNAGFKLLASKYGWTVDSVFDLARVFRLPGSLNVKDPDNPKPVTIMRNLSNPALRYEPEDFDFCLPDIDMAGSTSVSQGENPLGLLVDPEASPDFTKFQLLMMSDPKVESTWRRKRRLKDQSLSSYDVSLANFAAHMDWEPQEIANLIIAFRRNVATTGKEFQKALRLDYLNRTIARVLADVASFREKTAENEASSARDDALEQHLNEAKAVKEAAVKGDHLPPDEAGREKQGRPDVGPDASGPCGGGCDNPVPDPEPTAEIKDNMAEVPVAALLEHVSERLGIKIYKIIEYTSEPPVYEMRTSLGPVQLGKIDNLIRIGSLQRQVAQAIHHYIPTKIPKWNVVVQAMLHAITSIDPGEETREDGKMRNWLRAYLQARRPVEDFHNANLVHHPFKKDGRVYIFQTHFRMWLSATNGEKLNQSEMGVMLRRFGCDAVRVGFSNDIKRSDGAVEIKRTTASVYRLPDEFNSIQTAPRASAKPKRMLA